MTRGAKDQTEQGTFKARRLAVRALDKAGSVAKYLDESQRLVADFSSRSYAWLEVGRALTGVARYDEALQALDKCIRLTKPEHRAIPFKFKGDVLQAKGSFRSAERWYRKAIDLEPKNADWLAFLGSLLARAGRLAEAKDVWRKHIRLGTGATDEGHLNLGLIYRAEQKYGLALRHAEKAIAIDPGYEAAKRLRADLLEVMGKS